MHAPSHRRTPKSRLAAGTGLVVVAALAIALVVVRPWGQYGSQQVGARAIPRQTQVTGKGLAPASAVSTTTLSSAAPATSVATSSVRPRPATTAIEPPRPTTSSCRAVVHIGDSTSESLVSADYLPNPAQRLSARYAQVGAVSQNLQISGARSIVETYGGQPNAYTVAEQIASSGYRGCWVVAMGINDAADIAAGSHVGAAERIQRMMSVIGKQPVLWIAVKTLVTSGPYAETNMESWNTALLQSCSAHPNMRVLNWAAQAQPNDYIPDGIHYNSPGSAVLAAAFAEGLATAFPSSGRSPASCLVT